MDSKLLKEGDVIVLEPGMIVKGLIPKMFAFADSIESQLCLHDIEIGKNYTNKKFYNADFITQQSKKIVMDCGKAGFLLDESLIKTFLEENLRTSEVLNFCIHEGKFLVVKTALEGGSKGHDAYPDGHHVFVKRLKENKYDPNGIELSFYQTGCFCNLIKNVPKVDFMPFEKETVMHFRV